MSGQRKILDHLQTTFVSGLAVIIPLALTFWFLQAFLNAVDGILSPLLDRWLGREIPGLGFVSMVVIIFLVGVLARNLVGRLLFTYFEKILRSIPFVRSVYGAIKDLVGALSVGSKGKTFQQVVLVQYPRAGLYSIGFVTNETSYLADDQTTTNFVNVYFPHPPNPTSGVLILVPKRDAVPLNLTIEQGLKFVLSGGIVTPELLKRQQIAQ
ncbi:MAG: DUF502 domain-containing protein [Ignavibacteria bacterium]|nr:DUF502 domain-containing protein [Ignavibacteria bacterium]